MARKLETDPKRAASQILREFEGDGVAAELKAREAWEYHHAEDGEEAITTRFWAMVLGVLADRTEDPPVPRKAPAKRFDANGKVIDTPPQVPAGPQRTRSN